jgi:membrane protein YqaA with SNARE-associated domain
VGKLKRLYDWVEHFAETPYGSWALFLLAFAESTFFPVPPDILLIALAVSIPSRALRYALICSAGSVLGGVVAYVIGYRFMEVIGFGILNFYGLAEKYEKVAELYNQYNVWVVGIAGFTPIPYKVFTISAGAFKINFSLFLIASLVSRSARFFLVSGLIYIFGKEIRAFIERYFNILAVIFVLLLVVGFILLGLHL